MFFEILVVLTGVLNILSLVQNYGVASSYEKVKSSIRNVWIFWASVACLLATIVFTILYTTSKEEREKNELLLLLSKFDTTHTNIRIDIAKSDSLLDSLRTTRRLIDTVGDLATKELNVQKGINTNTQVILDKNKTILDLQVSTLNNTKDILHPFFPLTLSLDINIPFSLPEAKPIIDYVYQMKPYFERYMTDDTMRNYGVRHESYSDPFKIDMFYFDAKRLEGGPLEFTNLINTKMYISIFKGKLDKLFEIPKSAPQLNFTVTTNPDVLLRFYFIEKEIRATITYNDLPFINNEWQQSNSFIASTDLHNYSLLLEPFFSDKIEIETITLTPKMGFQQPCTIDFTKEERLKSKWSPSRYLHKFSRRDFKPYDKYNY